MDLWDRLNDTISIVLWPAVVGLGLVLFRKQIRELIGRIREGSALGVSFKAAERVAQVNSGFLSNSVAIAASVESENEGAGVDASDRHPDGTYTRGQVEGFIRAAGEAGYQVGRDRIFESAEVEPVLSWTDDGAPAIDYWKSKDIAPRIRQLEEEIRELRRRLADPTPFATGQQAVVHRMRLSALLQELALYDPDSPALRDDASEAER